MIEAAVEALRIFLSVESILIVLLGVFIGMSFGAVPGLGGVVALALVIPMTYGMDATHAFMLFGSIMGGVAFGGSVTAILLNIPGTAPNAATLIDGHPLAKLGRAQEAIGASATASAAGAIFGLIILVIMIPVVRPIVLLFGPIELFWLAMLGIIVVAAVGEGDLYKSIVAGLFGLMVTFIGHSLVTGTYRFGFGTQALFDGIQLIPVIIGVFAISEAVKLLAEEEAISRDAGEQTSSALTGVKEVIRHPIITLRCAAIGTLVGIAPGAGGSLANFLAYFHVRNYVKDNSEFGKGDIRGVIGAEAANDAKDGGSLIPTIAFGIPGNAVTAVLLGAFILHGIEPGKDLLVDNLHILFVIIFSLLASNIITSLVGVASADHMTILTKLNPVVFAPAILLVSFYGAFSARNNMFDVYTALVFGIIGYVFIYYNYSRIVLLIAVVLGGLAERAFLQTTQIAGFSPEGYWVFVNRPQSAIIIVFLVITMLLPVIKRFVKPDAIGKMKEVE